MKKLPPSYFQNADTLFLAKDLLGKVMVTHFNRQLTSGRIVETEAYLGIDDRASHAFAGKRTARTEAMYLPGGHAYVYLCYGLHHLFNIVTHKKNVPHAILIRALEPMEGQETMRKRRNGPKPSQGLARGPGSLSQAMGVQKIHSGLSLSTARLFIADDGFTFENERILTGPRIGVGYAGTDAFLPYRYYVKNHPFVSK